MYQDPHEMHVRSFLPHGDDMTASSWNLTWQGKMRWCVCLVPVQTAMRAAIKSFKDNGIKLNAVENRALATADTRSTVIATSNTTTAVIKSIVKD